MMKENRTTIYTLAEELGVSVATISRAFDPNSRLSQEKRKLILATAKKYGYKPNKMASRLSMDPIRIGVLNFSYIKAFYTEILEEIRSAYENLKDYKIECDIRVLQRGEDQMSDALEILDEFLIKKYDGVIISGMYEECVVEYVNKLADAGIRVATVQYNLPDSRRLFSSLSNYEVIGRMAAQLCGMLLRSASCKKTVMFTGNHASPTHRTLIQSFRAASAENGFEIVDIYDTQDRAEVAEQMVNRAFREHPDIAAIYASSANSLPICRFLEKNGDARSVVFVASDVFNDLYPYLEKGYIDATIYQEPFKMGYDAFDRLFRSLADAEEVEEVVYSTPRVVLSSNLYCFR